MFKFRVASDCRIGQWGFPGGRLEYGEEIFHCAERETLEETGLQVQAIKSVAVTNTVFALEKLHYITIYVICERLREDEQPEVGRSLSNEEQYL